MHTGSYADVHNQYGRGSMKRKAEIAIEGLKSGEYSTQQAASDALGIDRRNITKLKVSTFNTVEPLSLTLARLYNTAQGKDKANEYLPTEPTTTTVIVKLAAGEELRFTKEMRFVGEAPGEAQKRGHRNGEGPPSCSRVYAFERQADQSLRSSLV